MVKVICVEDDLIKALKKHGYKVISVDLDDDGRGVIEAYKKVTDSIVDVVEINFYEMDIEQEEKLIKKLKKLT